MSTEPNPTPSNDSPSVAAGESSASEAADRISPRVDRAGDNTPTKPGTEAAKASSGLADHSKHPPSERAEGAAVAVSGDEKQK